MFLVTKLCPKGTALSGLLLLMTGDIVQAAGNFARLQASFTIAGLATDPFDYAVTDVKVQILQPNATTISLPAFFDGGTTWRVRHTPTNAGVYQITGVTLNGSPQTVGGLTPTSWTVSGNLTGPGYVRRDPSNASRFITGNGRRFYPFGHNVAWDQTVNVVDSMPKLATAHENWARIWMNHWDSKNLDWPASGSPLPLGQLNLTVAQKWDSIVTAAEKGSVFMQMVLQHHGQYSLTTDSNWAQNPYSVTNGGFLDIPAQFFTNATAKALTKRKIRYAIARWGYSPAIMAWELFNEVQFTQAAQGGQWNLVGAWHDEMALFIRSQDPYAHLITTSSEVGQPIWNQMDYFQHHDYPSDYITALADPVGVPPGPVKPIFGGEAGRDSTTFYGQHAPVWAGVMGNQSGASQPWYWDTMDSQRAYSLMRAGSDFVRRAGIAEQETLVKTSPKVTTPVVTGLVFAPGGGYANATQDTFTVGDAAPAGIGTLPSFLQGNFHRSMTPNGFTFLVNYPLAGTFSVQIVTIAASGASLQIFLDNVLSNSVAFPSSGSDINTNFTLSINVPAGPHTIRLWNPGQDWLNLGNITLNPYVSIVGAYQIGNTNLAALWLWHRTNIYNSSASATVNGTLPLNGLAPGTYSGTWWDTFAGTAISNFNFTVVGTNAVTLTTPNILRSTAFFAGKAAQTTVMPPLLTRTLGTNSPALNLPLTITNSGGLPVAYSLSVTGISPVAYTALNSSQPGGPVFNWRDISGIGTDVAGSFTALVSPTKTARDEGITGPINLGFNFPFFSGAQSPGIHSQVYISPNGFITLSPFVGDRSVNTSLPNASAPTNMIAPFWDDLDVVSGSSTRAVYVDSDPLAGTFTVQFNNVRFKGVTTTVTCQVILKSTGEILMQYRSLAVSNACTVGLQNAAANQGLQIAFNQNYLATNFAIRLTPHRWLDLSANAGVLPKSSQDEVNILLNPTNLAYGTYSATLLLQTDDAALPFVSLPITLNITPQGTWRQTNFGTAENSGNAADTANPDGDSLINILEYAFNTNPNVANASPISYAVVGNHLTITFTRVRPAPSDITYLYEVADEVTGPWQSGPAFTTQNVTDNGNGTETVTVTDNLLMGSSTTHYLRVRISVP